ncbi:anti-sigma factor [Ilumatobacter sp.]|uniref:anti-sigma factor n=1 Tax=Ilumatobacter sp. TaxID=1967498 RepID=UPI003B51EA04
MRDDELNDALRDALLGPVPDVDERRVDALRAAVDGRRDAAEVDDEHPSSDPVPLDDRRRRRRRLVPVTAVAATILLVVGGAVALRIARQGDATDGVEYAGPIAGPAGSGELRVVETGIGRVVDLDTRALEILPTGEYYEVWFVADDDTPERPNRISAGTFHPDPGGRSRVTFAAAVDPARYPTVEITAEPGDGDPAPTGPTVMTADIPAT